MNSLQYFDSIAESWNVIRSEYFEERLKYKILSITNVKDKVVADLGCGTGFVSLALANEAGIIFSVDSSRNMLKELSTTISKKGYKNVYPIKSSLDNLALFDESLNTVFINMVLHHIKDVKKAIEEMYRVLKKDGVVVISDVMEHEGEWAREEMFDEWLGFSNEQMTKWLEEAGFKNIKIENTDLSCKGYSSKGEYTETGIFLASAVKL
ncbi:methyltransferase domain protein [Clostridium argentinense CDC 2741]|uniref:Methyltransferase domain protein n=1 Tax=Clostridium argentinense CDC 2741 TaxID=1418104 RepID=A0A0C1R719_9CLOT|nr:class I SAM-dependent methyltransferase [Clostridium argentinense]ARC86014.1 SAM-dependent methyltransferase [Clostridium argentinense]KIE46286.1 methyltransferase domain protein [Clostridium argentinense CDC 2741]NFF38948.1 class I SAM-dependent methyltransferase [Clostridium argentinense]NFP48740.1 class I SAM-dependent methyltransferase [Clostridium argentinense]NFP70992.1 class I SAM-dependent methyltransferase [Clostridium argentinense]